MLMESDLHKHIFFRGKKRDNKYSAGRHGSPSPSEIEADMPEIPRKNCIFVPSRKLKKRNTI